MDINVVSIACLPPLVTTTLFGSTSKFEYFFVVLAISSLKIVNPPTAEYLWYVGFSEAILTSSITCDGVGKSGSPAPKPITGLPCSLKIRALLDIAIVPDGVILSFNFEIFTFISKCYFNEIFHKLSK